jgi:hypothetical protein
LNIFNYHFLPLSCIHIQSLFRPKTRPFSIFLLLIINDDKTFFEEMQYKIAKKTFIQLVKVFLDGLCMSLFLPISLIFFYFCIYFSSCLIYTFIQPKHL